MRDLFPEPSRMILLDGSFDFSSVLYLTVGCDIVNEDFIDLSQELLKNFTCGKTELRLIRLETKTRTAVISCCPITTLFENSTEYDYELEVSAKEIKISYSEPEGLIHAFSTVLLLIEPYSRKNDSFSIRCRRIWDSPAMSFRCMHFVIFPEVNLSLVRRAIRLCGILKCSHVILEFWGMMMFDFMKELAWENAYTKDEIRELLRDGRAFGMEFIPMMNQLGHASYARFKSGKHVVLDQAPEYEELFEEGGWTWKVSSPEALELLSKARDELYELFGGEYFHCGADEAYNRDDRNDPTAPEVNEEFISYINYLIDDVRKHGKKPIIWADMFLNDKDFPYPCASQYVRYCTNCESNLARLDRDAILADWEYELKEDDTRTVDYFLKYRDPAKLLLATFDRYDNIRGRAKLVTERGLLGMIGTTWHRLNTKFIQTVFYTPCVMWRGNGRLPDICTEEVTKSFTARCIAKLLPFDGVYENSGFFDLQVCQDIDGNH